MDRVIKFFVPATAIVFFIVFSGFSSEKLVANRFENNIEELNSINLVRLYNGQKDNAIKEDEEYNYITSKRISEYLKTLKCLDSKKYNMMSGNYRLVDSNNNYVTDYKKFFLSNYISILEVEKGILSFQSNDSTSKIYINDSGEKFFQSKWIEAIRQIKIIDDKMYIYILDGDYWVLDSIHEDGKFFFKKTDENVFNLFSNMDEWFEKL